MSPRFTAENYHKAETIAPSYYAITLDTVTFSALEALFLSHAFDFSPERKQQEPLVLIGNSHHQFAHCAFPKASLPLTHSQSVGILL